MILNAFLLMEIKSAYFSFQTINFSGLSTYGVRCYYTLSHCSMFIESTHLSSIDAIILSHVFSLLCTVSFIEAWTSLFPLAKEFLTKTKHAAIFVLLSICFSCSASYINLFKLRFVNLCLKHILLVYIRLLLSCIYLRHRLMVALICEYVNIPWQFKIAIFETNMKINRYIFI
jgi:hypothetical protein